MRRTSRARPQGFLSALLDLVLAPRCLGCDGAVVPGDEAATVCRSCRCKLLAPPSPICQRCGAPRLQTGRSPTEPCLECAHWPAYIAAARSAFMMHPPADRLVHQLKYHGWTAVAEPMGTWMGAVRLPFDDPQMPQVVIPVGSTAARIRERGYNQAELLAQVVGRCRAIPMLAALERRGSASTQTTLQPVARGANVAGAFSVCVQARAAVAGAHILLVDDVLTTGATVLECARALVLAGAARISVITFARAAGARRPTTS